MKKEVDFLYIFRNYEKNWFLKIHLLYTFIWNFYKTGYISKIDRLFCFIKCIEQYIKSKTKLKVIC